MDSQSKFLLRVAHAIFFLRPANVLYTLDTIFGISNFSHKTNKTEIILVLNKNNRNKLNIINYKLLT